MTYKEIHELALQEMTIDRLNLSHESPRTPNILMRFLDIYRSEKIMLHKMNKKFNEVKKEKWEYYSGKAPEEVYINKPFDIKVLRQDLDIYLNGDSDLIDLDYQIQVQKEKIFYLEKILRGIEQREFSIKNAITMIKHDCGEL